MKNQIQQFLTLLFVFVIVTNSHSQCLAGQSRPGQNNYSNTTGNAKLDRMLNQEKVMIESVFNIKVKLFIMDDSGAPNAQGGCRNSGSGNYNGEVYFGINLLRSHLLALDKGEIAVAGILAHELAHVFQCTNNSSFWNHDRKRELQADMLAGYYLGKRGGIHNAELKKMANSLFDVGDWFDPSHHGTPNERISALFAGFSGSGLPLSEAYETSFQTVSEDLSYGINDTDLGFNRHGENKSQDEIDSEESFDDEEYEYTDEEYDDDVPAENAYNIYARNNCSQTVEMNIRYIDLEGLETTVGGSLEPGEYLFIGNTLNRKISIQDFGKTNISRKAKNKEGFIKATLHSGFGKKNINFRCE